MRGPLRRRGGAGAEGFTLLEVLLALTILAFGFLALAAMQLHSLQFGRSGKHSSQAAVLARNKLEELQRLPWAHADLDPTGAWTAPVAQVTNVASPGGIQTEQTYNLRWRVSDVVPGRTRSVDVQIQWNEPERPNRLLTISSIRRSSGP